VPERRSKTHHFPEANALPARALNLVPGLQGNVQRTTEPGGCLLYKIQV